MRHVDYAASNIRINAICPGVIDTEMIDRLVDEVDGLRDAFVSQDPVGRLGTVDEIADRGALAVLHRRLVRRSATPSSSTAAKPSSSHP